MGKVIYSVPEAIAKAEQLMPLPEVMLSHEQVRAMLEALLSGIKQSPCYYKALMTGRRTFVLLEGDPAAAPAIEFWAREAELVGHREEKVQDALGIARAFAAAPKKDPHV
jgi:hypothetical protein